MQKRLFFLVTMLMLFAAGLQAQITTSAMSGKVTLDNAGGEEVVGATIQVVHEPSGTRYMAVSNVDGRFNIQGMRPGGPYSVTVSYIGYQTKTMKDVTLQLGETYNLNLWLSEDATQLSEVVVSAKASKFAAEKTGATTNISNVQIQGMPTATRSITDIARLSPYANGMSFAGGDGRSTNFTLDGANMNNNFGLTSSLPGGGSPISLDAIDEIQVVVSPFDVRQSNFIGGGINAVTKSGTNTFRGTAYIYHNNENMHGNRVDHADLGERGTVRNTTYGFTLGGPIIKDKLFFFGNLEYSKVPSIANRWRASEDGIAHGNDYISRTSIADMQRVQQFMRDHYGYDTGSYNSFPADEDNLKVLARVDWNITDAHHLAVRLNHTKNTAWNAVNGNSSDTGYRLRGMDRMSQYSMAFANSMYSMDNKITTVSADLNSRFGSKFANQLLFTYSNIEDVRGSNSSDFPFIDIMNGYETGTFQSFRNGNNIAVDYGGYNIKQTLEPYMSLGYELFTYNNKVQNKVTTITDNFTWYAGNHKVTAGFNFEHQLANNAYMRGGTGYYRYRSVDDLINGAAPEAVCMDYGYNGQNNPNVQVQFNQYGLYLQDEWNVNNKLKLTGGIRFDNITFNNDDIMTNNAISALDFGGRHIDTGKWPKTNIQVSPRVGFSWDVFGNNSLKVRGGTGLFAGRLPLVFFTNMPTNSGMIQNRVFAVTRYEGDNKGVATYSDPRLEKFKGGIVTDRNEIIAHLGTPTTITPEQGVLPSTLAGVDRNFKMPQVWKSSVAVDYVIPVSFPWTATAEFTYTKKINDVLLENYNINGSDRANWSRLSGADDRMLYPSSMRYYNNISDACVLTNTHKGYGYTFNLTTNLEPIEDLHIMAAYTHTVMKEISGMPGSNASSAWSGLYTVDGPNYGKVQNSAYVIPDRIIASIDYTWQKHDHFSLFYQGYSPAGYSYFYKGDINGDGISNDLMYIPANDDEIQFTKESDRELFWNYVNQDKYLKNHKGEYAEAYSARAPWVHRFDFRWAHDFTLNIGSTHHKLELSANIENIGNLFNSKWGVTKNMSNSFNGQILSIDKVQNGVPYFSMAKDANGMAPTETWSFNRNYNECWKLQIGVKYYFN
ncbi:Outer membrane receptor proteins, mostly Fe transport [Prevotellaceae bacterium KH2P17]|nr:Outer membrane receptor proteins, mostly Fe transport [Prevotellaceae bacterium KH2P17]